MVAIAMGSRAIAALPFGQIVILLALAANREWGLPDFHWGRCWGRGILAGLAAVAVAAALGFILDNIFRFLQIDLPEQRSLSYLRNSSQIVFAFVAIVAGLCAPFVEEVYFRGWWLDTLKRRLGSRSAILLTAAVFALLHIEPSVLPGLFAAGIIFGIAAMRWGVVSAIVAHMVFNAVTILAVRGGWM